MKRSLKGAEFHLPPGLASAALRWGRVAPSPYTPEMEALGCIFIHVPKTAGTSLAEALFRTKTRHIPAIRYRAWDRARFTRYFKFCVVRNPFDRLHSAYAYLHRRVGDRRFPDHVWATDNLAAFDSFEAFVDGLARPDVRRRVMSYIHFRPQHHWVRIPGESACAMDKVARFETLTDDFEEITARLGVEAPALPRKRAGDAGDYRDRYSTRMRGIVADLYRRDLEIFGYDFG